MADPVLITGATGKTGRAAAALLGDRARAVSRSTPLRFDWHDDATWPAVTDGVDRAYLVRPDLADAPERIAAFLDAAPALEHVVLLSEIGAGDSPDGAWEQRVERAVTERARSWTVLRATWFQQVLTDAAFYRDAIRAGELALPSRRRGDQPGSMRATSPRWPSPRSPTRRRTPAARTT